MAHPYTGACASSTCASYPTGILEHTACVAAAPCPALCASCHVPHATYSACRQRRNRATRRPELRTKPQAHLSQHNTRHTIRYAVFPACAAFVPLPPLIHPFPGTLLPPWHAPTLCPSVRSVRQVVLRVAVHHHLRGRQPLPRPPHRHARHIPNCEARAVRGDTKPLLPMWRCTAVTSLNTLLVETRCSLIQASLPWQCGSSFRKQFAGQADRAMAPGCTAFYTSLQLRLLFVEATLLVLPQATLSALPACLLALGVGAAWQRREYQRRHQRDIGPGEEGTVWGQPRSDKVGGPARRYADECKWECGPLGVRVVVGRVCVSVVVQRIFT